MDRHEQPNVPVYVVDLAGLQFQQAYNSGKLVLVISDSGSKLLDDFIFENVVGEKKTTYEEASERVESGDERFIEVKSKFCKQETYSRSTIGHKDCLLLCFKVDYGDDLYILTFSPIDNLWRMMFYCLELHWLKQLKNMVTVIKSISNF